MAKKTPAKKTVGRPAKSTVAPGIFLRGDVFWLRYSAGGEQVRVSLETSDPAEAIRRADERRGRAVINKAGRTVGGKTQIDRDSERYQAARKAAGKFTEGTAKTAAQAIKNFQITMEITDPAKITTEALSEYYRKLQGVWVDPKTKKAETKWKKAEATAQTYVTKVATFARWLGYRVNCPDFPEAPSRETVVTTSKVAELLENAENPELQFILLCGFRAGMRRGEISMARPAWFDLENNLIRIPAKDLVSGFVPKSKRARTIPLVPEFADFIREKIPDWNERKWCIRPEKEPGEWIYRFDFRKMFKAFASKHCPSITPHVMRHSFASNLANGGVGIAQLASWTGDRIATLERHYLHLQADAEKAEQAFARGVFRGEKIDPNRNDPIPEKITRGMEAID